jgi:hypothetical protein
MRLEYMKPGLPTALLQRLAFGAGGPPATDDSAEKGGQSPSRSR